MQIEYCQRPNAGYGSRQDGMAGKVPCRARATVGDTKAKDDVYYNTSGKRENSEHNAVPLSLAYATPAQQKGGKRKTATYGERPFPKGCMHALAAPPNPEA